METPTLNKAATLIVELCQTDSYEKLNDYQKEQLTACALHDLGNKAYESVDETVISPEFTRLLIDAVTEKHTADKAVLMRQLGEMLVAGAIESCKGPIEAALHQVEMRMSFNRQLHDEQRQAANSERAIDMNLTYRGY